MNADGSDQMQLSNNENQVSHPAWSPDGQKIAFDSVDSKGNWAIYVMNADGSGLIRLTNDGHAILPAWSPDGQKIAFNSESSDGSQKWAIYLMNADGSHPIHLADNDMATNLAWSPDGQKIAYSYDDLTNPTPIIYVMNADGSNQTRLTGTQPGWEGDQGPAWTK